MKISTIGLAAALTAFAAVPLSAQIHLPGVGKKDSDKERADRAAKADAKNLATYEKIKTYSIDKYQADPDFHNEVDDAFDELLRQHTAEAYDRNIHRGSKVYAVHEDRFRLHEALYDNLLVQDHINHIGQSLVPKDSDKVFAFRLTPDPTPNAETLATGTIYISTGMLSLLDNEAQVAYVLAHEMAHVQLDHWRQKVMMQRGLEAYNAEQNKKIGYITGIGTALGLGLGAGIGRSVGTATFGAAMGATAGLIAGELMNPHAVVQWDKVQEDEADKMAFKTLLDTRYDVREVPRLYQALDGVASQDSRTTLGFLGHRSRIKQRKESADNLIANAYKADIEMRLKNGGFTGDSAAHRNLMAELKRDNGIMAYYHDMFMVARKNLEEATSIRENDPAAQYFLGKVLEVTGRTPEERKTAETCFAKAAQYDDRSENFGAHLHYALMMMGDGPSASNQQIARELDTYVTDYVGYQAEYAKFLLLPPNLTTIYEYMRLYGERDWKPKIPDSAIGVRVNESLLPSAPQGATGAGAAQVKPASTTERKLPACPANTPANQVNVVCTMINTGRSVIKK